MSDAPDRIWAVPEYNCTVYMSGNSPITAQTGPFEHRLHGQAAAYVRADLSDALLREAMEALENAMGHLDTPISRRKIGIDPNAEWLLAARATLAKLRAHLEGVAHA